MSQMLALQQIDNSIDLATRQRDPIGWLENAVTISLFTDARATDEDTGDAARGYWGDQFLEGEQSLGSTLWLLRRQKQTPAVVNKARDYAEQALVWLVEDGFVKAVKVATQREGNAVIQIGIELQLFGRLGEPESVAFFVDFNLVESR